MDTLLLEHSICQLGKGEHYGDARMMRNVGQALEAAQPATAALLRGMICWPLPILELD
jgi:hypothetical protein